tara:strand:+ start:1238 stop:1423 length:186 start_codon:yes stop_codon:yes gene_type:complete
MKVKGLADKLEKFNAVGMPCSSKEFNDLRDGKTIALSKENAELMSSMGLVEIIENKKIKEK